MASVNIATLVGYTGDKPKEIQNKTGRKMATVPVATTERGYKKEDGTEIPDRTDWHDVTLFGQNAEFALRYIGKGSLVYVRGAIRYRTYEDQQGQKRRATEITANDIQLLDRKEGSASGQTPHPQPEGLEDVPF